MADTLLVLDGAGLPPFSARGLSQTLQPIESGDLRRTVNGDLRDLTREELRKYRSTISGSDQQPPAFGALWRGAAITVDCIEELCVVGAADAEDLPRAAVAGSIRYVDADGQPVADEDAEASAAFTFFRPALDMLVVDWSVDTDEWGAVVSWSLTLEEV